MNKRLYNERLFNERPWEGNFRPSLKQVFDAYTDQGEIGSNPDWNRQILAGAEPIQVEMVKNALSGRTPSEAAWLLNIIY